MARKEPFGPIWNYDDPEEKKGRKKMTLKELDRERGKRGAETETPPPAESKPVEEKHYRGMFEEERASHKMTKTKEKTIAVVVVVLALVIAVLVLRAYRGHPMALPMGSAGAIFGVSIGSAVSLAYMIVYKHRHYSALAGP